MPLFPATKLMDLVIGVDVHAVAPIPGIPVHPYVGPIYLWCDPTFPKANVFINSRPAMTVGSMGYFAHIPQGVPVNPPNTPYWKRYLTNIAMGVVLMGLTTLANIAIAGIASLIPKPPEAEAFLKDVTGIDTSSKASAWESIKGAFSGFTQWSTWVKLLMPPIPYPGAQGSVAVGSPNVTVNGGPLGFVAPLVATSCSDIPIVPNAVTLGVTNVLVGVSFAALLRGIAVSAAQNAVAHGVGKGVEAAQKRLQEKQNPGCGRPGEPIDPVTGAVESEWVDMVAPGPPAWRLERAYSSAWSAEDGPFGFGHRAGFQQALLLLPGGDVVYEDERQRLFPFSPDAAGRFPEPFAGYSLEQYDRDRFVLRHPRRGALGFARTLADPGRARLTMLKHEGVHHAFGYDAEGRLISLRQTAGGERQIVVDTRFRHDAAGHLIEVLRGAPGEAPKAFARYEYDREGNLAAWIDAEGAATVYAYDRAHRMVRLTDRRRYSFHYAYDAQGRCIDSQGDDGLWKISLKYGPDRTFVTEGDGGLWVYAFDELGTIREVIDPFGGTTKRETGPDGRVIAETDPGGRTMRWLYSPQGHHHARLDALGHLWPPKDDAPELPNPLARRLPATPGAREGGGMVAALAARLALPPPIAALVAAMAPMPPAIPPARAHDIHGRVIAETDASGRTERFEYDAEGKLVCRIDADGAAWRTERRSWNLAGAEIDPLGNATRFRHNLRQQIHAVSDAAGNLTFYDRDHKDRVVRFRARGHVQATYRYDDGDRVVERRDGEDRLLLRYTVGKDGLHSARELASGGTHRFAYDARGRFTEASTDVHKVTFVHGAQGRLADLRDGVGITHAFRDGTLTSTGYLGRFLVTFESAPNGATVLRTPEGGCHRIIRDGAGTTLRILANGSREVSVFDAGGLCLGRARWREHRAADATATSYAYSATGELRAARTGEGAERRCTYDAAHRLIAVEPARGLPRRYAYDAAGNLTLGPGDAVFEIGPGNQILAAGETRFVHDARGRISERHAPNGRVIRYSYDSLDMLVAVHWSDRAAHWEGAYDGLCRLVEARLGDARTQFHWDGDRLAAERAPDGRLRLYVYPDASSFLPVAFLDYAQETAAPETGRAFYPFHDQVGLPQHIEDDRGAVVWRAATTDAYGLIGVAPESRIAYRLRFPGHVLIEETGLHANRFRSYDPALGRYLQPDPSGQRGGINLYAYTANPLVKVDLLGLHEDGHEPKSTKAGEGNEDAGPAGAKPPGHEEPVPPKALKDMTPAELQAHVEQRAADLKGAFAKADPEGEKRTTLSVGVLEKGGDPETRRVAVSTSADDQRLPPSVKDNLQPGERPLEGPPYFQRNTSENPNHNPDAPPDRVNNPKTKSTVNEVDMNTGKVNPEPYQKAKGGDPPEGTQHHAEQRMESGAAENGEHVLTQQPTKPCCPGCTKVLGDQGKLDKIPNPTDTIPAK